MLSHESTEPPAELRTKNESLIWLGFAAFVALCSWLFFGNLVTHPLDIHDADLFEDNVAISANFSHFISPEKKVAGGRPLTEMVRWLTYVAVGNDPRWFHLLGLFFHSCASILVARLGKQLGIPVPFCFAIGILFLANVTHFQAIHWITGLDYPLALTLGLASVISYSNFRAAHRRLDLWLFFFLLLTAVFAQPTISMLLVFCFFLSWQGKDDMGSTLRRLVPLGTLLALANLVVIQLTSRDFTTWLAIDSNQSKGVIDSFVSMGHLLLWFLSRLLTTAHWVPLPIYEHQNWELVVGVFVLLGLMILIWKNGPSRLWAVWILVCLGPFVLLTTDVVFTFGHLLTGGSRFLYFASVGSSALLAWLLHEACVRLGYRVRVPASYIHATFLAGLMISSYVALKKVEAISFYGAGRNYLAIGDFENGVEQLRRAIKQSSSTIPLGDAFLYLCIALPSLGEDVEPTLKEALQTFPENPELAICRLVIDTMSPQVSVRERAQEKVDFFKGYVDEGIPKLIALFYHNIGHGLYIQEKFEKAILTYSRALEFEPERATTLHSLALALSHLGNKYANLGLHQISEVTFLQAIEIRPNLPLAHFGLTGLYLSLNDRDRSKTHYEILKGLDHDLAGKLSTFF